MDFKTYWKGLADELQVAFAAACGVSKGRLYLIAMGHGRPGALLAIKIETASGGLVHRSSLRPDLWSAPSALEAAA